MIFFEGGKLFNVRVKGASFSLDKGVVGKKQFIQRMLAATEFKGDYHEDLKSGRKSLLIGPIGTIVPKNWWQIGKQ